MSGPGARKPLDQLVRKGRDRESLRALVTEGARSAPASPAGAAYFDDLRSRAAAPASRPVIPDASMLRLEAANARLAQARQDWAAWKEESAWQITRWDAQMEARHAQWMAQTNERLGNMQQGRQNT